MSLCVCVLCVCFGGEGGMVVWEVQGIIKLSTLTEDAEEKELFCRAA